MFTLPDHTCTTNHVKYAKAWHEGIDPVLEATGGFLIGFDPGYLIGFENAPSCNLDYHVAKKLSDALRAKK